MHGTQVGGPPPFLSLLYMAAPPPPAKHITGGGKGPACVPACFLIQSAFPQMGSPLHTLNSRTESELRCYCKKIYFDRSVSIGLRDARKRYLQHSAQPIVLHPAHCGGDNGAWPGRRVPRAPAEQPQSFSKRHDEARAVKGRVRRIHGYTLQLKLRRAALEICTRLRGTHAGAKVTQPGLRLGWCRACAQENGLFVATSSFNI